MKKTLMLIVFIILIFLIVLINKKEICKIAGGETVRTRQFIDNKTYEELLFISTKDDDPYLLKKLGDNITEKYENNMRDDISRFRLTYSQFEDLMNYYLQRYKKGKPYNVFFDDNRTKAFISILFGNGPDGSNRPAINVFEMCWNNTINDRNIMPLVGYYEKIFTNSGYMNYIFFLKYSLQYKLERVSRSVANDKIIEWIDTSGILKRKSINVIKKTVDEVKNYLSYRFIYREGFDWRKLIEVIDKKYNKNLVTKSVKYLNGILMYINSNPTVEAVEQLYFGVMDNIFKEKEKDVDIIPISSLLKIKDDMLWNFIDFYFNCRWMYWAYKNRNNNSTLTLLGERIVVGKRDFTGYYPTYGMAFYSYILNIKNGNYSNFSERDKFLSRFVYKDRWYPWLNCISGKSTVLNWKVNYPDAIERFVAPWIIRGNFLPYDFEEFCNYYKQYSKSEVLQYFKELDGDPDPDPDPDKDEGPKQISSLLVSDVDDLSLVFIDATDPIKAIENRLKKIEELRINKFNLSPSDLERAIKKLEDEIEYIRRNM